MKYNLKTVIDFSKEKQHFWEVENCYINFCFVGKYDLRLLFI